MSDHNCQKHTHTFTQGQMYGPTNLSDVTVYLNDGCVKNITASVDHLIYILWLL